MEKKVLLAFATNHGSTKEVADEVAVVLRQRGLECDVLPARAVRKVDAYRAVILGSALYMFHFHKDATQFLARNKAMLCNGLPIAIFAGGPTGEGKPEEWGEVRKHVEADLAKMAWLKPASLLIIGGRHDPELLRFPWNLVPALKQMPPNDLRDWQAIRSWAGEMADQIAAGNFGTLVESLEERAA